MYLDVLPMLFFTDCGSSVVVLHRLTVEGPHVMQPRELFFTYFVTPYTWGIGSEVSILQVLNQQTLLARRVHLYAIGWHCQIELVRISFPFEGGRLRLLFSFQTNKMRIWWVTPTFLLILLRLTMAICFDTVILKSDLLTERSALLLTDLFIFPISVVLETWRITG